MSREEHVMATTTRSARPSTTRSARPSPLGSKPVSSKSQERRAERSTKPIPLPEQRLLPDPTHDDLDTAAEALGRIDLRRYRGQARDHIKAARAAVALAQNSVR